MPGPLSPASLAAYADPRYLSRNPQTPDPGAFGPNWMHRLGLPVLAAGQGMDTATTLAALQHPALQEGNPLYGADPSAGRVIGMKLATMAPLALLLDKAYAHAPAGSARRKMALAAAIATGALGAFAGAHNMQMVGR